MEFKGTKGEWRHIDLNGRHVIGNDESSPLHFIDCWLEGIGGIKTNEEAEANALLIADAGNTIQLHQLMPSELLRQYGILLESTSNSMEAIESILKNYKLKEVHAKAIQTIIDTNKKFKKLKTWK
jgi:hypothetical protein